MPCLLCSFQIAPRLRRRKIQGCGSHCRPPRFQRNPDSKDTQRYLLKKSDGTIRKFSVLLLPWYVVMEEARALPEELWLARSHLPLAAGIASQQLHMGGTPNRAPREVLGPPPSSYTIVTTRVRTFGSTYTILKFWGSCRIVWVGHSKDTERFGKMKF